MPTHLERGALKMPTKNVKNCQSDSTLERRDLFAGAGLVVCKCKEAYRDYGTNIVVETEFAVELSNLIFEAKRAFRCVLDGVNKFEFYRRIGVAANIYLATSADSKEILNAVQLELMLLAQEAGVQIYFAYGSNMDAHQMQERCPDALLVGRAELEGFSFALDMAGAATVLHSEDDIVHGVMWIISGEDETCLDLYEGVSTNCYSKERCKVIVHGKEFEVLVYVSQRDQWDGAVRNGGLYLKRILAAARANDFPKDYMAKIQAFSVKDE